MRPLALLCLRECCVIHLLSICVASHVCIHMCEGTCACVYAGMRVPIGNTVPALPPAGPGN